jgi:hypothetical protein
MSKKDNKYEDHLRVRNYKEHMEYILSSFATYGRLLIIWSSISQCLSVYLFVVYLTLFEQRSLHSVK